MGYPLGLAPLADGTGTTPTDLQRIIGAQYVSAGLLPNGGGTTTGTSSMAYSVSAGACFMWTSKAAGLGMLVPFEATTVQTDPAPATGSRTDTVYVDANGAVRVAIGSASSPSSGVAIARWTVPAGITATTAASLSIDRDFAIPAGASLGRLAWYKHPTGGKGPATETTMHVGRFFLPSDRVLRADLTATLRSDTSTAGIAQFEVSILDASGAGSSRALLAPHTTAWNTWGASWTFVASEGPRRAILTAKVYSGGGWRYASSSDFVTEFTVWDGGVSR